MIKNNTKSYIKYYYLSFAGCLFSYISAMLLSSYTSVGKLDSCLFLIGTILFLLGFISIMTGRCQETKIFKVTKDTQIDDITYFISLPSNNEHINKEQITFNISLPSFVIIFSGFVSVLLSFTV